MNHFNFNTDLDYAKDQDTNDELGHFRSKFHLPEDKNGYSCIYMCGNSLGLQTVDTKKYLEYCNSS